MQLTDTHCHLDFHKFDQDRPAVLERAAAAGVVRVLIPAITLASSRSVLTLAESHPMLYAAIGVHPTDSLTWEESAPSALVELALHPRVVAIGEIGLDYYWDSAPHDHQQKVLRAQLDLAAKLGLPVVIHLREKGDSDRGDCGQDALDILEKWLGGLGEGKENLKNNPGVLHSFSGSLETARRAMGLNFYIGITGPITFKNAVGKQELVAALPLDRLLIETDAPFLTPHPHRGKRNEPAYVAKIADKIARLQSRTLEEVAAVTTANAARLFSWGESY